MVTTRIGSRSSAGIGSVVGRDGRSIDLDGKRGAGRGRLTHGGRPAIMC